MAGHSRRSRVAAVLVLPLALLITATGCIGGLDRGDRDDGRRPSRGQDLRKITFDIADGSDTVTVRVPAKPVATVGTTTDGVNLEVYKLERVGGVVNVVVAAHNTNAEPVDTRRIVHAMDESPDVVHQIYDTSNISLIDLEGLKDYRSFIEDDGKGGDGGTCLCSYIHYYDAQKFAPDERRYFVTQVAAPPAEVSHVTVNTGTASVADVAITG